MRVISGTLKGRFFESPKGNAARPMADKVKNALFNILGDISDLSVLDPFGGTGALGIESVSRGASEATVLEKNYQTFKIINTNVESLGVSDRIKVTKANASSWSENNQDKKFDLILADPPFGDPQLSTIDKLTQHLKSKGLMVICHSGREASPTVNGVVVVDNHNYGDAALSLYRLEASD